MPLIHARNAAAPDQPVSRDTLSFVLDLETDGIGRCSQNANHRDWTSRMPMNIRKAFLHYAKHCCFQF
jgi:hypothetical protein